MSEKRKKFIELAEKRVNRVVKDLRLVGNLSNKNNYVYKEEEAEKICNLLVQEVQLLRKRFSSGINKKEIKFKL